MQTIAPSSRPDSAHPADAASLLAAVLDENRRTQPERLRLVLDALTRHLFAFVQETRLNYEELEQALDFLNQVGKASGPKKNEAILLADVLGLSTLVQLQDAERILATGGTEPALIGPFWRAHHPPMASGADIFTADTPGIRLEVRGRVQDLQGAPLSGAVVDVWQASPVGLYENQDDTQADMNLRGRFTTDGDGRFSFRTVKPAGYPIPIDGPVGRLLEWQQRSPMRPAHIHFLAIAQGYRVLATQIFDDTDPGIHADVVFGAVGSLVRRFSPHPQRVDEQLLEVVITLEPGETRIPHPPLE
jgi:catechol 1,2-dioxygenase